MGNHDRKNARLRSEGFTLIASLLLLLLLSGMSIGLLMMVNTEQKVGGTDLQNNLAYHIAEGGIETMETNLVATFQAVQSPTIGDLCDVNSAPPVITGVTWTKYSVTPQGIDCATADKTVAPPAKWGTIGGSGPNNGLQAQIIPVNMVATATLLGGQQVSMTRTAQVALIPVFQFGVFCEGDCAFYSSPDLDFAGRVHTNGDLYVGVANNNKLVFHSKLDAYGNIVTANLPNGLKASSYNDSGKVYIPKAALGCDGLLTAAGCGLFENGNNDQGSVVGKGGSPPGGPLSTQNPNWKTISTGTFQSMITDGDFGSTTYGTGAKKLSMPFVTGTIYTYELIRQPVSTDSTALSQSREYNLATIRVLLADDPAELPGGAASTDNVRLANVAQTTGNTTVTPWGVTIPVANYDTAMWGTSAGNNYNLYFATASNAVPIQPAAVNCSASGQPPACTLTPDWPYAPGSFAAWSATQGLQPAGAPLWWGANTGTSATISICPPGTPNLPLPTKVPVGCPTNGAYYPYYSLPIPDLPVAGAALTDYYTPATSSAWSLIDGYLRVEYADDKGVWQAVTNEWLQLGFARGVTVPTAPGTNPINKNAILLLQEPADRSTGTALAAQPAKVGGVWAVSQAAAPTCKTTTTVSGTTYCATWTPGNPAVPLLAADNGVSGGQWAFGATPTAPTATTPQSLTQFNWYPINFYDAREGEARDTDQGNNSCTAMGVMNAVEIDVGNLKNWLANSATGKKVGTIAQNGYVLYFSDRRGMLPNPNKASSHPAGTKSGDSGFEDVVNSASAAGATDGVLETAPTGGPLSPDGTFTLSPEDVNENGKLDNWGSADLGQGFWNSSAVNLNASIVASNPDNPYSPRITSCGTTGRKSWVSGARHVLKLVDGSLGNLPTTVGGITVGATVYHGGFTVASENPVYIQDDYNSVTAPTLDTFFSNVSYTAPANDKAGYVPASVIADAVTILSNNWDDRVSMVANDLTKATTRPASTTSYRVAIAAGKNMAFPFPGWENATDYGFGTDGGVHNFLRFLEDWQTTNATLNYGGSLVSLYYSTYGTGLFKCCTYSVYQPPDRNYIFDADFTLQDGAGLPPGTPMFKDVDSLGYRQMFTARTN